MMSISTVKQDVRKRIKERIEKTSPELLEQGSSWVCQKLATNITVQQRRTLIGYMPVQHEVNILPFLKEWVGAGKQLGLPRLDQEHGKLDFYLVRTFSDLELNAFHILEPKVTTPKILLDKDTVILVPGLAFDTVGNRLGRGVGYYDRTLGSIQESLCKVGICFEMQIMKVVPTEEHDQKMNLVITEKNVY